MKALLIIDVQNDYFPGGNFELFHADEALINIKEILSAFRNKKLPIIHVQHISVHPGATFFLPGTEGVKHNKDVMPAEGEFVVKKNFPNSFLKTDLNDILNKNNIKELVVCGMMTHMCIDSTVRAAQDYNLTVTTVYDACATRDLESANGIIPAQTVHDTYMAGLNGSFANVILSRDLVI